MVLHGLLQGCLYFYSNNESDTEEGCEEEPSEGAFYLAKDKQTRGSKNKLGFRIRIQAYNRVSQAPGVLGNAKE
jgi:hypothetical protein